MHLGQASRRAFPASASPVRTALTTKSPDTYIMTRSPAPRAKPQGQIAAATAQNKTETDGSRSSADVRSPKGPSAGHGTPPKGLRSASHPVATAGERRRTEKIWNPLCYRPGSRSASTHPTEETTWIQRGPGTAVRARVLGPPETSVRSE